MNKICGRKQYSSTPMGHLVTTADDSSNLDISGRATQPQPLKEAYVIIENIKSQRNFNITTQPSMYDKQTILMSLCVCI